MSAPNRNDPCPCGSGKKYKKCCLAAATPGAPGQAAQPASHNLNATNVLPPSERLLQAVALHQAGKLDEAQAAYQSLLTENPADSDALHYLGLISFQQGDYADAARLIEQAIQLNGNIPAFHFNLGNAYKQVGQFDSAIDAYRRATQLDPGFLKAHLNLGLALQAQGKLDAAIESYQYALSIKPDYAEVHNNMGNALQEKGKLYEASESYRHALALKPDYAKAYNNLGAVLRDQGKLGEAVIHFKKALALKPDYAEAHYNFGIALQEQDVLHEAEESYRKALLFKPDYAEACNNLGTALQGQGRVNEAVESYRKALLHKPDYADAYNNLGLALQAQGKLDAAVESYQQALKLKPDYAEVYSNMLFLYGYHALLDPQEYLILARGWERAFVPAQERQLARARTFQRLPLAGQRLRVGYVSGDYRQHAVSYFVEQLFAHHDRARIELFAYSTNSQRDAVTTRLQTLVDHWVPLNGIPDVTARERIEADGIDVLIDLSGHTAHNRLGVFARRAAPVQAHYLGFFASTGLTEMDYWIGDETLTPPETDSHFSEQVWHLPRVWVSYDGKTDAPLPDCRPDQDNIVWLGSFNNLGKLTPATLALWAKVLHAMPEGGLLLKTKHLADAGNRQRILDGMAAHGISPDRIELRDSSITPDWSTHMAYYNRLDIALDPAGGVGGGTTTCDALWMGVPVITLKGDRMASRMTASMLNAIGHPEWIAHSEAEYVGKVVTLARNTAQRKALRLAQRKQMADSPLCDAQGLAMLLENAYFAMYQRWQERQNERSST